MEIFFSNTDNETNQKYASEYEIALLFRIELVPWDLVALKELLSDFYNGHAYKEICQGRCAHKN